MIPFSLIPKTAEELGIWLAGVLAATAVARWLFVKIVGRAERAEKALDDGLRVEVETLARRLAELELEIARHNIEDLKKTVAELRADLSRLALTLAADSAKNEATMRALERTVDTIRRGD